MKQENLFKKVKTKKDILNDPRVLGLWKEETGWWVELLPEWRWDGCCEFSQPTIGCMCYAINRELKLQ